MVHRLAMTFYPHNAFQVDSQARMSQAFIISHYCPRLDISSLARTTAIIHDDFRTSMVRVCIDGPRPAHHKAATLVKGNGGRVGRVHVQPETAAGPAPSRVRVRIFGGRSAQGPPEPLAPDLGPGVDAGELVEEWWSVSVVIVVVGSIALFFIIGCGRIGYNLCTGHGTKDCRRCQDSTI